VSTGRLVGGDLDGVVVEIEQGRETIEMSPMVMFGTPASEVNRMRRSVWVYRYASVEDGDEGPEAIFEFVEHRERA
jgi:hypothetical protein